jgi:hypothetical protein
LKEDLQQIASNLPQYEISVQPDGAKMVNRFTVDINLAYQFYLANSVHFQVLEYLFFHPQTEMEEVLEHFFMSYPTFYRTIRRINRWFNGLYNIQVSTKPLAITGNENEIRFFFGQYFAERYPSTTWPFEDIKESHVDKFVATFIKILNRPLDFSLYYLIKRATIINIKRHHFKWGLPLHKTNLSSRFAQALAQKADQEFVRSLSDYVGEPLGDIVLSNLLYPFLREDFFYNFEDMLVASRLYATIHTSLIQAQQMIEDIRQHFDLKISNPEVLTILFHNASSVECYEVFAKSQIFRRRATWMSHLYDDFPDFYGYIEKAVIQYRQANKLHTNPEIIRYLIYTIFSTWSELIPQLMTCQKKIRVGIFSSINSSHSLMIRDLLTCSCSQQLEFHAPQVLYQNVHEIIRTEYDVILSNVPIPQLQSKLFININAISIEALIERLNNIGNELAQCPQES